MISGLGALLLAGSAQATLIVRSIDVAMVETGFNSRDIPGYVSDDAALALATLQFVSAWANPEKRICELASAAFENLSSRGTCDGPQSNVGTLFSISGSASGATEIQFGLDWGRGGFSVLQMAGLGSQIERYTTDIWWGRNWNHQDVLSFVIPQTSEFRLVGLGFDACCNGSASARWRALGPDPGTRDESGEWQTLAQSVPSPGSAYLIGLGLCGFVFSQRKRMRD